MSSSCGLRLSPCLPAPAQFAAAQANGICRNVQRDHAICAEVPEILSQLAPCHEQPCGFRIPQDNRPYRSRRHRSGARLIVEMQLQFLTNGSVDKGDVNGLAMRGYRPYAILGSAMNGRNASGSTLAILLTTSRAALAMTGSCEVGMGASWSMISLAGGRSCGPAAVRVEAPPSANPPR